MLYIYKFTNKVNDKKYVGQTNDIQKRINGHKSTAFNPKSQDYKSAFHRAVRKYGWENFDFEILEELDDSFGRDYLNEREKFFIEKEKSLVSENGYNIAKGGQGSERDKKTFEQCVASSKIFTLEEIKDVQRMLIEGYAFHEIRNKYPKLSDSFLSNINTGLNFINPELKYPLATCHSRYTKETKEKIIKAIKDGVSYREIKEKYHISPGYVSEINAGNRWRKEGETYPLYLKECADGAYSRTVKHDLIFTNKTCTAIAREHGKAQCTISAINTGRNRKDSRFLYPLNKNQEENQKIWSNLF